MSDSLDQIIEKIAEQHEVPASLINEMLIMEREVLHLKRRRGLVARLQEVLQNQIEGEG